jgi:glycosyltransferase involved in cell wall biosynthesis
MGSQTEPSHPGNVPAEEPAESVRRRAAVVLGMHRSGTSALARMLSLLGLALPKHPMGPSKGNELGHWGESDPIRWLHEEILHAAGSSWDDVSPLPTSWFESSAADEFRARLASALADEYPGSGPFVVKDPRICRLLPLWTSALDDLGVDAAYLLALRNPLEVAASLAHRDGFGHSKGLLLWLRHTLDAERGTRETRRALVSYAGLLRDWRATAAEISDRLDLEWPLAGNRASAAIDRSLLVEQRHHEFSTDELSAREDIVDWVQEVWTVLLEAGESGRTPDAGRLDAVTAALADADQAYGEILAESKLQSAELGERLDRERRRYEAERADFEEELKAQEEERAGLKAVVRGLSEEVRANKEGDSVRESRIEELSARVEADEAELSDATTKLEEREATARALAAELARLEGESQEAAKRIEELRGEAESRESAARQRELALRREGSELRQEIVELRRELRETNRAIAQLRDSGLGQRLRQRYRSTRQLGSWLLNPRSKGRPRNVWEFIVLRRSGLFDSAAYLRANPDVADAGMNPLMHYIEHGARTGRNPSASFDTAAYYGRHPGLRDSGVNPLYHYFRSGGRPDAPASPEPLPAPLTRSDLTSAVEPRQAAAADPSLIAVEVARRRLEAKPLTVSVVVPTHNRASVLREALRSVLGQSYQPLEVIVSDDASTDETESMLRSEFAAPLESGLLRYMRSDERRGPSGARNVALRVARGDLIAYLDSDNAWREDFLLLMAASLAEHADAATAYCGFNLRRDDEETPRPTFQHYERAQLLARNFIDLNSFVHRRRLYEQLGGFDESMTRLVDWELVLRYTACYRPVAVPYCLLDYYAGEEGNRVTHTASFDENAAIVRRRFAHEQVYAGLMPPRIGYVLWDYPALSQSFVLAEIRELIQAGHDVHVYHHVDPDRAAEVDFEAPTYRVDDAETLARLISSHKRTVLHSHFVYPAVTKLTYPAAVAAGVPFTFMVHAVDIFHRSNIERNRVAEIANHELCLRVFGAGEHHRDFLLGRGVRPEKLAIGRQGFGGEHALAPRDVIERRLERRGNVVACIARFVEKKGVDDLIRAGARLGDRAEIRLYGYGPLDDEYRALARELGADHVQFRGPLEDDAAVRAALDEADVFALPCVVDSDGDMDGLPTVLGEAMTAGVPVVTTDVSSIPEIVRDGITGFVAPPRDPDALARKITDVLDLDRSALDRVIHQAQRTVTEEWNLDLMVDSLLDAWERPPLEIAMVTYNPDGDHDARDTTLEILRRVYDLTTTSFRLTIVDNGSDPAFTDALAEAVEGHANTALILLDENVYWGPAVNRAFRDARSEYLLYVCSNEGFLLRPGWEREYVKHLRDHRYVALAGHPISSPAYPTGAGYMQQPWFERFRNKEFAQSHPDREFFHVQGGLFALRRTAFTQCGQFSELVSQDAVDIEYSYLVESHGWKLGRVERIPSVTTKTLPRVQAHVDENTLAVHPLTLNSLELAADVANGRTSFCNVCGSRGDQGGAAGDEICGSCGATPFGRTLYRYLARSSLPFRGLSCVAALGDESVASELERMFALTLVPAIDLTADLGSPEVVIADVPELSPPDAAGAAERITEAIADGGVAIMARPFAGENGDDARSATFNGGAFTTDRVAYASKAVAFLPTGLLVARAAPTSTGQSEARPA